MSNQLKGNNRITARRLIIHGKVQGVGFRPFIYRAAKKAGLTGFVANNAQGVVIEVEGDAKKILSFTEHVRACAPPAASIARIEASKLRPKGYKRFSITASEAATTSFAEFPPDLSVCPDCQHELFDPHDRRFLYPFLNCTNCGPRFTIVTELPYDRPKTTMRTFTMCPSCRREYTDPSNRRFHAQPNACPDCGPELELRDHNGLVARGRAALTQGIERLHQGQILAIKSLGGFHLSCDGASGESIAHLRTRKHRPDKPFALMAANIRSIESLCHVSEYEKDLLSSPARPIVLLRKRSTIVKQLPFVNEIAPRNHLLGIMLPYTPLHLLLFSKEAGYHPEYLIMTSGNRRDEPICRTEEEAYSKLGDIADAFLVHNRPIHNRCDDSIVQAFPGRREHIFIRRSRGFVPDPVLLHAPTATTVFAAGAEMKNTFCLTRGQHAYISPYIGDLDNRESLGFYKESLARFRRFLGVRPEIIASDLHPDYLSTVFAKNFLPRLPHIAVSHHVAHLASVLAEKDINPPVIGFAFDGTGLGSDGTLWGGECFSFDGRAFHRRAHLERFALPGGDTAVIEIWRIAVSLLDRAGVRPVPAALAKDHPIGQIRRMVATGVNAPLTSSVGRLFDGIAAILGVRTEVSFEAQAAIELEMYAASALGESLKLSTEALDKLSRKVYNFNINLEEPGTAEYPAYVITINDLIRGIYKDLRRGLPLGEISLQFHLTLIEMVCRLALLLRDETGSREVILSGGVFQNQLLLSLTQKRLAGAGFRVHFNTLVPPNDGGISLGQAWAALKGIGV